MPDKLPNDAQSAVEAYRSRTGHFERLTFGEVGAFKASGGGSAPVAFKRIPDADGLRFRVKVTDKASGRLLAEKDGLRSVEDEEERSVDDLFPLRQKNLNGELWRVEFTLEGPELWVEKTLGEAGVFLWTTLPFQSLVLPQAMRIVAERLVRRRDQPEDWHDRWRAFLCGLHPGFADLSNPEEEGDEEGDAPADDVVDQTCDELAAAFARKFNLVASGLSAMKDGGAP